MSEYKYEYNGKYLLVDNHHIGNLYQYGDTLDDLLEYVDERFVFNGEINNEFFEDGKLSRKRWEDYLTVSLRDRLSSYHYFSLCKWNSEIKTYIEDDVLGSRTYPNGRYAQIKWQPNKFPHTL